MHFSKSTQVRFQIVFFCCVIVTSPQVFGQNFKTIKTDEGVEILENDKKVLFYQRRPKSLDGKYERASYVHPLYDLNENVLTEDFPEDHPHHRGIFWAWHQIVLNGKQIGDGWMCENTSWEPSKLEIKKNHGFVMLQSEVLWKVVLQNKSSTAIVKENTKITVYRSTGKYRAIDFEIQLSGLADSLEIGGSDDAKGYGGFSWRLKLPNNISFVSENKEVIPQDTAIEAGPWMDFSGSFDNESSQRTGVAVFINPSNAGSKQLWILRKKGSMQNNPYPGRKPIALTKNGLRLKYRVIIHNADMGNDELQKLYQQYCIS